MPQSVRRFRPGDTDTPFVYASPSVTNWDQMLEQAYECPYEEGTYRADHMWRFRLANIWVENGVLAGHGRWDTIQGGVTQVKVPPRIGYP